MSSENHPDASTSAQVGKRLGGRPLLSDHPPPAERRCTALPKENTSSDAGSRRAVPEQKGLRRRLHTCFVWLPRIPALPLHLSHTYRWHVMRHTSISSEDARIEYGILTIQFSICCEVAGAGVSVAPYALPTSSVPHGPDKSEAHFGPEESFAHLPADGKCRSGVCMQKTVLR